MSEPLRAVLDTDTFNEIDDQFAVVYAVLSPSRIRLEALYAAPFQNGRSSSPADGMAKSHGAILRLLDRLPGPHPPVLRGSLSWLPAAPSPASEDLIARARAGEPPPAPAREPLQHPAGEPLPAPWPVSSPPGRAPSSQRPWE